MRLPVTLVGALATFALGALGTLGGCADAAVCEDFEAAPCECPYGGLATQHCLADGSGFAACECPGGYGDDTGGDGDGDGDGDVSGYPDCNDGCSGTCLGQAGYYEVCAGGCSTDGDCSSAGVPASPNCTSGQCVLDCLHDSDCPSGMECFGFNYQDEGDFRGICAWPEPGNTCQHGIPALAWGPGGPWAIYFGEDEGSVRQEALNQCGGTCELILDPYENTSVARCAAITETNSGSWYWTTSIACDETTSGIGDTSVTNCQDATGEGCFVRGTWCLP